jgi:hypothetical protein
MHQKVELTECELHVIFPPLLAGEPKVLRWTADARAPFLWLPPHCSSVESTYHLKNKTKQKTDLGDPVTSLAEVWPQKESSFFLSIKKKFKKCMCLKENKASIRPTW